MGNKASDSGVKNERCSKSSKAEGKENARDIVANQEWPRGSYSWPSWPFVTVQGNTWCVCFVKYFWDCLNQGEPAKRDETKIYTRALIIQFLKSQNFLPLHHVLLLKQWCDCQNTTEFTYVPLILHQHKPRMWNMS